MHKTGRIVLLLPRQLKLGAGFVCFDMRDTFSDGPLYLFHAGRFDAIGCDRLNRHTNSQGLKDVRAARWTWRGGGETTAPRSKEGAGAQPCRFRPAPAGGAGVLI